VAEQDPAELVPVGVVGRAHGLRGEMCIHLHDPTSHALFDVGAIVVAPAGGAAGERYALAAARHQSTWVVIRLEGVATREQAEQLRGQTVMVERSELAEPREDEYYDYDLVGMSVTAPDGEALGTVVAVEHPPANDVLVVELAGGALYLDVPMVEGIVVSIALERRAITVDVPPGLPTRARR
jgi:16S rRNA processing protein RimM